MEVKVRWNSVAMLCLASLTAMSPSSSAAQAVEQAAPTAPAAAPAATRAEGSKSSEPTGAAEPARGAAAPTADELSAVKVKTLEERVSELKERIFRTKARLQGLQELVIGGDLSTGAKAVLFHRNEMGSSFLLESVSYALDGAPVYAKADEKGDLDKRDEFEIFNGRVVPGNHQINVRMVYRGHGYGVFSYLEGYRFKVQSSYTFNAEPGKATTVRVVGFEKGGLTTDLKDRPAVRYDVDVKGEAISRAPEQPATKPPAPAPSPTPPSSATPNPTPTPTPPGAMERR